MEFPLGLYDLSIWLAISAIILLATSEIISPTYGHIDFIIKKGRLRRVAIIVGFLFLSTIAIRIYQIILTE
ncbi:MAG: hypothetical protein ACFFDT_40100 [Candidatus Hodarchaeota archaeon]